MIRTHDFNTAWWGGPVGILTDLAFFAQPQEAQQEQLRGFQWVELRAPMDPALPNQAIHHAGFFQVDTQLDFRIGLQKLQSSPSIEPLHCITAAEQAFTLAPGELASFSHERYLSLPGCDETRLDARFVRWSNDLIAAHPTRCLQVFHGQETQGWFLSADTDKGLHLALAMLKQGAKISGFHLYLKAMLTYAQTGTRVGWASFSASNLPVLNIYAQLGARFTKATGCWLWLPS